MPTIERLTPTDYEALIRHLNDAFGLQGNSFERLLPALYAPTAEAMACNYAIRRHGDLAAVVGLFPIAHQVGGTLVRTAGIGGVSTARQFRGQDLMKTLMAEVMAEMRRQGYAASYLGGQRQRYAYWGYERCGTELHAFVNAANLRHRPVGRDREVTLHPQPAAAAVPPELIAWHDAQPLRAARPAAHFGQFLRNWTKELFLARAADGRLVGYLVGDARNGEVPELVAPDPADALAMVRAWAAHTGKDARYSLAPLPGPLLHQLQAIAEDVRPLSGGNWQLFAWPEVLTAWLQLKHRHQPLVAGEVVVAVADGPVLALTVDGATARCTLSDRAPALTLPALTLLRVLFGPLAPDLVHPLPAAAALLRAWCPLPLFLPPLDHV
jgi:predicted N-acetyltransferase YhbS